MKEKPKPYTTTPRYITSDVRSGKMTSSEWRVYQWLRDNADPYGKVTTSLIAIRDDIYENVEANHINYLLLSLKKKRYVHYLSRQGRRGSFDVHFDDWLLPNGQIKHLDAYFTNDSAITPGRSKTVTETEVTQKSEGAIQKLQEKKLQVIKGFSGNPAPPSFRSHYNDTDTHKDNKSTLGKEAFKGTLVREYEPRTTEEARCYQIAQEVGEQFMNPLLSVLRTQGISIIERAWGIYREDVQGRKTIDNKPAYLQGIIKTLLQKANQ